MSSVVPQKRLDGEFSFVNSLYLEKDLLPPIRDQGDTRTCLLHALAATVESQCKLKGAEAHPEEDFEVKLSVDDFLEQYEKVAGEFGTEGVGKTGVTRLETALDLLVETGLVGEGDGPEGRGYKASSYKIYDKSEISLQEIAKRIRSQRKAMVASFKVSEDYELMKTGEIYSYKSEKAKKNKDSHTFALCDGDRIRPQRG